MFELVEIILIGVATRLIYDTINWYVRQLFTAQDVFGLLGCIIIAWILLASKYFGMVPYAL